MITEYFMGVCVFLRTKELCSRMEWSAYKHVCMCVYLSVVSFLFDFFFPVFNLKECFEFVLEPKVKYNSTVLLLLFVERKPFFEK